MSSESIVQDPLGRSALIDLEERGILSRAEARSVLARRERFEVELGGSKPTRASFLRYVVYELKLDRIRASRTRRLASGKRGPGDFFCVRHVYALYERALARFPEDLDLWLEYVAYAKRNKAPKMVGRLLARALQRHGTRPELWVHAAKWELLDQGNARGARRMLQRGLRLHKTNVELWASYFSFEVKYVATLAARRDALGVADRAHEGDGDGFFAGDAPVAVAEAALAAAPAARATLLAAFRRACGDHGACGAAVAARLPADGDGDDDDDDDDGSDSGSGESSSESESESSSDGDDRRTRRELRRTLVLAAAPAHAARAAAGRGDTRSARDAARAFGRCHDGASLRAAAAFRFASGDALDAKHAAALAGARAHARRL